MGVQVPLGGAKGRFARPIGKLPMSLPCAGSASLPWPFGERPLPNALDDFGGWMLVPGAFGQPSV